MNIARVNAFVIASERDDPLAGGAGVSGGDGHVLASQPAGRRYSRIGQYRAAFPRRIETMMVRIETDTGIVGYGEAQAPVLPEVTRDIVNELLRDILIGADPRETSVLWQSMYDAMRERGHHTGFMLDAISAVDIALWDIRGKATDLPVYMLLGGAFQRHVPVYFSGLAAPGLASQVALAVERREQGFSAFKVFLGFGVEQDTASVEALRSALGDNVRLMVDAHWQYDLSDALSLGNVFERYQVHWLESPLVPEDLDGHSELVRRLRLPIAIGEGERSIGQFRAILEQRAATILQPDVGRAGGITGLQRIAALADAHHVPVAPHCGVGLAPLVAASLQVAAALPNLAMLEYQPVMFATVNDLLQEPLVVRDGAMSLPERPGIGIAFDENRLARITN